MLKKWLKTNRGLKIISFLTTLLIWFHVTTDRIYERTLNIPISCINLKENLFLAKPPLEEVEIKVRGKGKELLRLGNVLKVEINLRNEGIGWQKVELTKANIRIPYDSKLEIIEGPYPASFIIRIDKKAKKFIKVTPLLDERYVVEISPESVEIFGGGGTLSLINELYTKKITPKDIFPETLKVALSLPEEVNSSVDSVTIILKTRL